MHTLLSHFYYRLPSDSSYADTLRGIHVDSISTLHFSCECIRLLAIMTVWYLGDAHYKKFSNVDEEKGITLLVKKRIKQSNHTAAFCALHH